MDLNRLIFGKNDTKGIVSIEPKDGNTIIYIQDVDGLLSTINYQNQYWILSPTPLSKNPVIMEGNLHYRYGMVFNTEQEFKEAKKKLWGSDMYIIYDPKEAFMVKEGFTYFKDLKIKDVSVLSFDLETTSLDFKFDDQIILISNTYRNKDKVIKKLFAYDEYNSQGEMLEDWCKWVREVNPSIILGHNINGFDIPYLVACAKQHDVELLLGRDGSALKLNNYESKFRKDQTQFYSYKRVKCHGREIIDTNFLAIKYDIAAKKYDSYALKNIIKVEKLESENRTFYDASKIRFNYKDPIEFEKIKDYCRDDSDDSLKLFDLMAPPFFYMTQSIPKSFQSVIETASGSQINSIMVRSYVQDKHSIPKPDQTKSFSGGLSDGYPGIYNNCMKIDVKSLYPSIMRQYKVYVPNKDPKKYFLALTDYFTEERLKNKDLYKKTGEKYYDDMQSAGKIFANSLFGFLGASGLNFNGIEQAEEITKRGREILLMTIKWATGMEYTPSKQENNNDENE